MVKRARPIQVRLLKGRTFISRYKRSTHVAILLNIELNRQYKQRPVPKKTSATPSNATAGARSW